MTKYIKVDWPECQKFLDHPRWSECSYGFLEDDEFNSPPTHYFIPEDLYSEVMYKRTLPIVYEDEDLGTIKCYDTYAIVNDSYTFKYDRYLEKGDKLLVYNHNSKRWKIVTCVSAAEGFPILTDDSKVYIGLTDELVGSHGKIQI